MTDVQIMDPNRTERNSYVCDYQLIRNAETIKEKRAILKENGRKTPDPAKLLDEKRFSILVPMTLPLRLFDHARQPLFDFPDPRDKRDQRKKSLGLESRIEIRKRGMDSEGQNLGGSTKLSNS